MSLNSSSISDVCTSIYTALSISYILLLPLFLFVLYVGYQRWRNLRSVATAATTTSHSDVFTFNMVILEMINVLGLCFYSFGTGSVITAGIDIYTIISPGHTLFHLLTCVERYLAVVHPVTYLGLRRAGGVRIRNVSIGCVWLLCFGSVGLAQISLSFNAVYMLVLLVVSSVVVSFCSLSVVRVLIRPGPGEAGGKRERVDQSKQRAFHTIVAIMGALLLRFFSTLVSTVIFDLSLYTRLCLVMSSAEWFHLPSSLVLPLLFLHRAGKLPDCKRNTESA